eukprot:115618-Pyramimonas_sp.AAC.1
MALTAQTQCHLTSEFFFVSPQSALPSIPRPPTPCPTGAWYHGPRRGRQSSPEGVPAVGPHRGSRGSGPLHVAATSVCVDVDDGGSGSATATAAALATLTDLPPPPPPPPPPPRRCDDDGGGGACGDATLSGWRRVDAVDVAALRDGGDGGGAPRPSCRQGADQPDYRQYVASK